MTIIHTFADASSAYDRCRAAVAEDGDMSDHDAHQLACRRLIAEHGPELDALIDRLDEAGDLRAMATLCRWRRGE